MSPHSDPLDLAERPSRGAFPLLIVILGLLLALVAWRYQPPAPLPASVDGDRFSALRAKDHIQELLGDFAPHPVGSAANAAVRGRLVAELERLGYAPEVQTFSVCELSGICAAPANVIARLDSASGGKTILLMAHYDSVPTGPGVSDDAAGVAALLEVARILASEGARRNSIVLLFTDAEEVGMLGARAFVEHNPWAAELSAVVNLEARGASGPSLMFETGRANSTLVPLYARAVERPVTSSLFVTLYEMLPNDTDFSVFKRAGVQGFNFAFIGDAVRYHAANDDLEGLDLGSLQHHGDNALALARALGDATLDAAAPRGNAVFFDVLATKTVWWPRGLSLPLAALGLAGIVLTLWLLARRDRLRASEIRRGGWVWLATILIGGGVAYLLVSLLRLTGGIAPPWANFVFNKPITPAFWLLALACAAIVAVKLGAKAGHWGLWGGTWICWGVLALALALQLPGASYLFIVPVFSAFLCGIAAAIAHSPRSRFFATLVPSLVAGIVWFPLVSLFHNGLGNTPGLLAVALAVSIFATTVTPELSGLTSKRWTWPLVTLVAGLFFLIAGMVGPPTAAPPAERVVLIQEGTAPARWLIPARNRPTAGPRLQKASVPFESSPTATVPWFGPDVKYFAAPAANASLPLPEVSVVSDSESAGERHIKLNARSVRGASGIRVFTPTPDRVRSLVLDGAEAPLGKKGRFGGIVDDFAVLTPGGDGVDIELTLDAGSALELFVSDELDGALPNGLTSPLPPPAKSFIPADRTASIAFRKIEIGPSPMTPEPTVAPLAPAGSTP